jgi:Uma2 family endonuclease
MTLLIELPSQEEQTEFNVRRWQEVLDDPELSKWEGRVETDRHGTILMSPPAAFDHGRLQARIALLLQQFLPDGVVSSECPISTRDGVRAADVAWTSPSRLQEINAGTCLRAAPEICVEVLSPRNRRREMEEKKALYFAAGAQEVWFCHPDGSMSFYLSSESEGEGSSRFCAEFPALV